MSAYVTRVMRGLALTVGSALVLLLFENGFAVGRTMCASSYASDIALLESYDNHVEKDLSTRVRSLDVYFANSAKAHDRDYEMTADLLRHKFVVHTHIEADGAVIFRYLASRFENTEAAEWKELELLTKANHSTAPEVAYVLDFTLDTGAILSFIGTIDRLIDPEAKRGMPIDCQLFNILEATTRLPEWPVENGGESGTPTVRGE